MRSFCFLVLIANVGCLRTTEFKCQTADQCSASGAACETNGYCSFPDSMCSSGRRYGEFSGSLSSKCVGDETPIVDGRMSDTPMGDVPPGQCPAGYTTLSGAGTHLYKLTTNAAQWSTQRDRCAADGSNVYLAIPDNQAELQAITTLGAAARTWVGIEDLVTEGSYVTVKGASATYLPWDTANGEPDNGGPMGGQDCVSALMASPNIATDFCTGGNSNFPAVCECEP